MLVLRNLRIDPDYADVFLDLNNDIETFNKLSLSDDDLTDDESHFMRLQVEINDKIEANRPDLETLTSDDLERICLRIQELYTYRGQKSMQNNMIKHDKDRYFACKRGFCHYSSSNPKIKVAADDDEDGDAF